LKRTKSKDNYRIRKLDQPDRLILVTLFLIAEENEKGSKDSHNPASTAAATTKRTKADATYNIYVAFF